jgi:outer membrane lipoprotein SlyB
MIQRAMLGYSLRTTAYSLRNSRIPCKGDDLLSCLLYHWGIPTHYIQTGKKGGVMQQDREGMQESAMAAGTGTMTGGVAGATVGSAAGGIIGWEIGMTCGGLIGLVVGMFLGLAIAKSK